MKTNLLYGLVAGVCYASTIALINFFRDKPFDLIEFVIGVVIFGAAMILAKRINRK